MTPRSEATTGMEFFRISVDPQQMGGVPCIRRLRIPVATIVEMVADGLSVEDILASYPDLEAADIREALRYAAEAVREREVAARRGALRRLLLALRRPAQQVP